jgi:hypothetical protein
MTSETAPRGTPRSRVKLGTALNSIAKLLFAAGLLLVWVLPCFCAVPYADEWLRASHFVTGDAVDFVIRHSSVWVFRPINDLVQALAIQPLAEILLEKMPRDGALLLAYFHGPYWLAYAVTFALSYSAFRELTRTDGASAALLAASFLTLWLLCTPKASHAFYWFDGLTTAVIPLTALVLGMLLACRRVDRLRWLGLGLILFGFLGNEMFALIGGAFIAGLLLLRLVPPSQHQVLRLALGAGAVIFALQTLVAGPVHRRAVYAAKMPKDETMLVGLWRGAQAFDGAAVLLGLCAGTLMYLMCSLFSPEFRTWTQRISERSYKQIFLLAAATGGSSILPYLLLFISKPDPKISYYSAVSTLLAMLAAFMICVGLRAKTEHALPSERRRRTLLHCVAIGLLIPLLLAPNARASTQAIVRFRVLRIQAKDYMAQIKPGGAIHLCRPRHPYLEQRSTLTTRGIAGVYSMGSRRVKERVCKR